MDIMHPCICYHIYNHANGDDNLFRERENYRFFLQQYEKHITPVADTLAYCLMPNHFHLLVRIKDAEALLQTFPKFETLEKLAASNIISKQFANLFSSYTQAFNKKYDRKGSLFQKNFKRKEIDTDAYFGQAVAYIHFNPIKHGFTADINDWEWTSYHQYTQQQISFIHRQPVLDWFGSNESFLDFHRNYKGALDDGAVATASAYD